MRRVFFDFDGTLVDSKPRLYRLFSDLVADHGLSFEEYWEMKRSQIGHEIILSSTLGRTAEQVQKFQMEWMRLIEETEYLALDSPFPGVERMLRDLKNNGMSIHLVTARQFEDQADWQLQRLGWASLFDSVMVTGQRAEKEALIRATVGSLSLNDIMIGDTGKDIQCGNSLGLITVAVLSGFRSRKAIEAYLPDYVFESVTDIDFAKIRPRCQVSPPNPKD